MSKANKDIRQQEIADHDAWFQQQVQQGINSANAGRLMTSQDVESKFAARRATTRRHLTQTQK